MIVGVNFEQANKNSGVSDCFDIGGMYRLRSMVESALSLVNKNSGDCEEHESKSRARVNSDIFA